MSAVIPLKRRLMHRKEWRLVVDDDNTFLGVIAPALKEPWVIPLTSIAGVCDVSNEPKSSDELTLLREEHVMKVVSKSSSSVSNLLVMLSPPQPVPELRFSRRGDSGFGRRSRRAGTALLDGFSVEAKEPESAASFLRAIGIKSFPSRRSALVATIGAVPIATLSEAEQHRVRRRDAAKRIVNPVYIVIIVASLAARVVLSQSPIRWWGWMDIAIGAAAAAIALCLNLYIHRVDSRPLDTSRAPPGLR